MATVWMFSNPTVCTYNCLKNPYTVKLHSIMFQWRPPPPSGKSTSTNQTTYVVSCLILSCAQIHPHQHRTC